MRQRANFAAIQQRPFVLIDDARLDGARAARLYTDPDETIVAHRPEDLTGLFETLRGAGARGLHCAGWLGYEAGLILESRLAGRAMRRTHALPLAWFGSFKKVELIAPDALVAALPDPAGARVISMQPRWQERDYAEAFAGVRDYIAAGDIYQANLTFRADVAATGEPLALYAQLRAAGAGGWSAVVFDGSNWLLSTSPELFFSLRGGALEARPMKGTFKRSGEPAQDAALAQRLKTDPKQMAENLMIVDLLRNDFSRVARRGTVNVPSLFEVETYPTLLAMTSTVRAELGDGLDVVDALQALFPCGSVTGAPKIRAMEIIDELEPDARGPYTGSIGWIEPGGDAEFNVAIRTLVAPEGDLARCELGIGSGVVYDSVASDEWAECLAKAAFLTAARPDFELIETMLFDPASGFRNRALHLARMGRSAAELGFVLDVERIEEALEQVTIQNVSPVVVRLALSADGQVAVTTRPVPAAPAGPADTALASRTVGSRDLRLRHKTSSRAFLDHARESAGAFEVLFVDEEEYVTEGSFTNIFVPRAGRLLTPPLRRGLLPGILRETLLREGRAVEADLRPADLAGAFYIGNSARGLIEARLKPSAAQCDRTLLRAD